MYLNLIFWDTPVLAVKTKKDFVPKCIMDSLTVNISSNSTNSESDIVIFDIPEYNNSELMLGFLENEKVRKRGIGNRKDMLLWFNSDNLEPTQYREPPTSFFSLIYS